MAIYSLDDLPDGASNQGAQPQSTGNGFLDWLLSLGRNFEEHYTRTNDVNAGIGLEGMNNIYHNATGDGGNALEQSQQEAIDDYNTSMKGGKSFTDLINAFNNGEMSALDVQQWIATHGMRLRPAEEAYLNNILGVQATESDRDYQRDMRDTSLISSYEQLLKLGMNPGSVVNVGGASSGVSSQAAKVVPSEVAKMQFNRRTQMAKTLIGLAGGLASTGFHGAALGAAKFAAAKLTSDASKYATDSKYNSMRSSWYDPVSRTFNSMYQKY